MTICLKTFFEDCISSSISTGEPLLSSFARIASSSSVSSTASVSGSGDSIAGATGSRMDSVFLTDSCDCLRNSARRSALDIWGAASFVATAFSSLASTAGFWTVGAAEPTWAPSFLRASSCRRRKSLVSTLWLGPVRPWFVGLCVLD